MWCNNTESFSAHSKMQGRSSSQIPSRQLDPNWPMNVLADVFSLQAKALPFTAGRSMASMLQSGPFCRGLLVPRVYGTSGQLRGCNNTLLISQDVWVSTRASLPWVPKATMQTMSRSLSWDLRKVCNVLKRCRSVDLNHYSWQHTLVPETAGKRSWMSF